ncbi:MAG: undecaprenyldiphospho-muramoylpentapeptide beta-N-acetylglucosaminyltransferase [Acidobacteriota bacterium]|nr:undecaprenyldiphospho-muramoylpentapeptide beta-N-acetylglucosaminyltransferase [Acidobacteriota bacterium]
MRVLIAGGGTGGHIIPALAVASELVARQPAEILFVGTPRGLETKLVPEAGFNLHLVEVGQLNNVSLKTRLNTLMQLPRNFAECKRLIREFRPNVVFGVGGYASGPAMGAAIQMKVPTMAFEPNAVPGLANRLIGRWVQAAAVNFPSAASWFRNAEVTGIPVRPEFFQLQPDPYADPHLLVFGGSQGARLFNTTMPKIVKKLLESVPYLTVLHQCGMRHVDATRAAFEESGADPKRWQVEPYLTDMPARFRKATLVMARSGASTVAELAAASKPSLLIPFAAAADNHQQRNAEEMVNVGAAVLLKESQLDPPSTLLEKLVQLLSDSQRLLAMGSASRTQAHLGATERIAQRLQELAGN